MGYQIYETHAKFPRCSPPSIFLLFLLAPVASTASAVSAVSITSSLVLVTSVEIGKTDTSFLHHFSKDT